MTAGFGWPWNGGGGGDDARHAGDRRGGDRHVRRGDHRELAGRDVAADRLHGDVPVAEDDAGQGLDLDVDASRRAAPRRSCAPAPGRSGCRPCPAARPCAISASISSRRQAEGSRARSGRTARSTRAPRRRRGPRCRPGSPRRWRGPSRRPRPASASGLPRLRCSVMRRRLAHLLAVAAPQTALRRLPLASNRWQMAAGTAAWTMSPISARYSLGALTETSARRSGA